MGMAASQARLLTLTARIHDVEYEAQALQNAKVELSTQSDRIYEDYLKALDETTLTVLKMDDAGNKSNVTATFNTLCSLNKVRTANGKSYAIFDERGRLIVEDDVYNAYKKFNGVAGDVHNAINFALYAMGVSNADKSIVFNVEDAQYASKHSELLERYYNNCLELLQTLDNKYGGLGVSSIYDNNSIENNQNVSKDDKENYEKALLAFRTQLYKESGEDIYSKLGGGKEFDNNEFQYYVSIFNQIQNAGGCVPISEFNNGDTYSNAANDSEWLKSMIESGRFTMAQVETDSKTRQIKFDMTSPNSDEVISYTQTTEIDKTALAKAEAEYEHGMAIINKKDERFDLDLSKLEAERTALTTEYDSLKKVIEDNIDRTFGIFS